MFLLRCLACGREEQSETRRTTWCSGCGSIIYGHVVPGTENKEVKNPEPEAAEPTDEVESKGRLIDLPQIADIINQMGREVDAIAKSKGWHGPEVSILELLLLIHAEVSEAVEEYRVKGPDRLNEVTFRASDGKPEGFSIEMADLLIRILGACATKGIDLGKAFMLKNPFNETRPHRHGNKFA